ncbi:PRC-barrel domain-containing protein [Pectinatus haikarae]|uniref:Uncharacterized protein YrrD n=1 Tax=Pectinatus haikarae TaxID=349096 RepID=A0ABT9Y971_9FIRM|nr:PRC-barrel domain-containing protein [Pectinatus haikarae]MDQ0203669.1 uncharacterized protein YrrD [Pectinatus haikarae]
MKKSEEFLGLPIISITEGRELGTSKSLLIDAEHGSIAAIVIEDEDWYRGVKLLPYPSVVAIGHDAVTITSSEDILILDDAVEYEPFLDQNIRIIGTKAITKGGTIQGVVSDIFIDDNGKIAKVVLGQEADTQKEITAEEISIFGREVTIIDSAVPGKTPVQEKQQVSVQAKDAPKPAVQQPKSPKIAEPAAAVEKKEEEKTVKPEVKSSPTPGAVPVEKETPSVTASSAEDRHRRFLLGKKATKRITTDNGIVIVEEGADITEEVLQKAKLANKFIDLSMNVK